jgi:hypothetical protein
MKAETRGKYAHLAPYNTRSEFQPTSMPFTGSPSVKGPSIAFSWPSLAEVPQLEPVERWLLCLRRPWVTLFRRYLGWQQPRGS